LVTLALGRRSVFMEVLSRCPGLTDYRSYGKHSG